MIFAYLGPGEPPLLPDYEFLDVPDDQRFVNKVFQECNYLQGNEGNIDPRHLSFLHRQFQRERTPHAGADVPARSTTRTACCTAATWRPTIEVEETDFGLRIYTRARSGAGRRPTCAYRTSSCRTSAPSPGDMGARRLHVNWHVPIDDTHHWKYMIIVQPQRAARPRGRWPRSTRRR